MSTSQTLESEISTISSDILKSQETIAINPSVSTESVDVVQLAPPTAAEQIEAREKTLKDRALKRMERRERNHQLAQESCQEGDALFEKNDYVGASARYIDATNLWSSNAEFYFKLTKAYVKCELYADAAHAATRALTFDPKSLEARYIRGVARLEQGLLPAAKIDFETVIAHDPSHALAHTSLGRTLTLLQATKIGNHVVSPPSESSSDGEPVNFAFPRFEDDKLELAEPSDSSDCNHVGNGVPCRFYNHDGCARGAECDFSHAPDEKSVRDDLGKNVCLYHLLSSCKFGDLKCIYSHSKSALPTTHGWWNDPEQIKRVKEVLELAEKKAKEKRTLEVVLYRQEAKKNRAKSQGRARGRGDTSKSKERSGGKGKPREERAKETETSVVIDETIPVVTKEELKTDGAEELDTAKDSTVPAKADTAEDPSVTSVESKATFADAVAGKTSTEPKEQYTTEDPSATSTEPKVTSVDTAAGKASTEVKEQTELNGGFTEYKLNEPTADGAKLREDSTQAASDDVLAY